MKYRDFILEQKDNMIEELMRFVSYRSVFDQSTVTKEHPFGNGGAHYVRWSYDDNGEGHRGEDRCLTAKMRRLCKDIITDKN